MVSRRQATTMMLAGAATAVLPGARAQTGGGAYPARAIRMIVPYSAGSTTDVVARLVAAMLGERVSQPVVVENRTGAGGIPALRSLQSSASDGYTVGLIASANVVQPWVLKDMPLDVRKQFMPLTLMYAGQYVFLVPQSSPIRSVADFVAFARANPQKVFFGSSGVGTTTHLAGELLKQIADVDLVHVPFKGAPEVYNALLGGHVQACFDLYGTARSFISSGQVRALAVTGAQRAAWLDVPALAETIPGYEVLAWTGFALPLGTPADVADRLGAELRAVLRSPELEKRYLAMGLEVGGNSAAAFQKFMGDEYDKWGRIVQKAGITPQ